MRLAAAIQCKNQLPTTLRGFIQEKSLCFSQKTPEFLVNLVRFTSTILVNFQFKRST